MRRPARSSRSARRYEHLKIGDRVCMEPGIPDPASRASRLGLYNVDPAVRFWATPPVHGVPDARRRAPRRLHLQAAGQCLLCRRRDGRAFRRRACRPRIRRASRRAIRAVVIGAGPIGIMVALAALAGGCARVIIADFAQPKLEIAARYRASCRSIFANRALAEVAAPDRRLGCRRRFRMLAARPKAWETMFDLPRPGGAVVRSACPWSRCRSTSRRPRQGGRASRPCSATRISSTARWR